MQQLGTDLLQSASSSDPGNSNPSSNLPTPRCRILVARTPTQVLQLQSDIEDLSERAGQSDDFTIIPAYFLSRIRAKKARPYVVAVYDSNSRLIGVIYGARRCLFGVPVGIVECGDACGDGSIISLEESFNELVETAIRTILSERFVYLARLSWNSGAFGARGRELEPERTGNVLTRAFVRELWHDLGLEQTYDLFLGRLGSQTRRNMRYYRRRAEQNGWVFVSDIGRKEAFAAMTSLYPLGQAGQKNRAELTSAERNLSEVPGASFAGLRTATGEWIGIIGGWVRGRNMFIITQLNNATYAKASVSTLLRSYVIEKAIDSGDSPHQIYRRLRGISEEVLPPRANQPSAGAEEKLFEPIHH